MDKLTNPPQTPMFPSPPPAFTCKVYITSSVSRHFTTLLAISLTSILGFTRVQLTKVGVIVHARGQGSHISAISRPVAHLPTRLAPALSKVVRSIDPDIL